MGEHLYSRPQEQAVEAAQLVLRLFKEDHPHWQDDCVPVEQIADWLGLDIACFMPGDHPDGTYGFIDPDQDEHLIWLCQGLPESLHRFTLAHELGHAILHCRGNEAIELLQIELGVTLPATDIGTAHWQRSLLPTRDDPCSVRDIQDDLATDVEQAYVQEWLGRAHAYDPRSQHELAANAFAAELLMPRERICALYLQAQMPPQQLAEHFIVSQAALLNRLTSLFTSPTVGNTVARPQAATGVNATTVSKKHYDEFQRAAIEAPTPALVIAGPGSGKTSTLIGRVEYLVQTLHVAPAHILALTFSRKAAQEMEERLQALLPGQQLPYVCTFHAFCADLLRQYGDLVGLRADFTLVDEAEGYSTLLRISARLSLRHYQHLVVPTLHFADMLKAISRAKDELVSPETYAQLARAMVVKAQRMPEGEKREAQLEQAERALEIAEVYRLYEEALAQRGDTDFGGLLVLAVRLLEEHPELLQEQQQIYQHILVDEFQDMNRASGVLLRMLAGEARNVWVVGDPNQAIYGFRGASPANIGKFSEDFPGATILPLSRNYRSRPDLVEIAEAFRCRVLEPDDVPSKNQPVRLPVTETCVTLASAPDEVCEITGILHDIQARLRQGYTYKDMAILCRTRTQVQRISRALMSNGIPVVEHGGLLEQSHVKDVLSIVLLHADSSGMGLLRAARVSEHALSRQDVEALLLAAYARHTSPLELLRHEEIPATVSVEGQRALHRLSEILRVTATVGGMWSLLARYLFIETALVRSLLMAEDAGEVSTTAIARAHLGDYMALLALARHYDQQYLARSMVDSNEVAMREKALSGPQHLMESAKGFLEYLSLLITLRQDSGERTQNGDEQEEAANALRVMTVHGSKGLEFPIVYLPGLLKNSFPMPHRHDPVLPPEGMLPPECEGEAAHSSGEACLFYVGATRARDALILSYSERKGKIGAKASPYLDALRAALPAGRVTQVRWEQGVAQNRADEPATFYPPLGEELLRVMKPAKVTASDLEAYLRCPRQYAYGSIYRFTSAEHGYRLFWQATQKTIEELQQRVQANRKDGHDASITPEMVRSMYARHWQALGGANAPFAAMYEQHGQEVMETVRCALSQQRAEWKLQQRFTTEVAGRTVQVTVDRVDQPTQEAAPVQFVRVRYGRRKSKPEPELREMLYTRAYRQQHPGQEANLVQHNLSTGEKTPLKLSAKKEQSLYEEAVQGMEGLERDEYPPIPKDSRKCPECPYFFICPA